jgi:ribose transport system permease protein
VSPRNSTRSTRVFNDLTRFALPLLLAVVVLGFSLSIQDFLSVQNLRGIAVNQIVTLFVALAVAAVLSIGEIDLSVANILGLSQALTVGLISFSGLPIGLAVVISLAASAVVGLINGLMVVRLSLNSLVATLAMSSVLTGLVLWYTKGTSVFQNVPPAFQNISNSDLLGVPLPLVYGFLAVVALEVVFGLLPTGRRMYAVGGNRRAALLSGIRVDRLVLGTFVAAGLIAGLAGTIIASRLGSASPDLGPSFLLPAFAAAFLGSTTIRPGRYNPLGTVVAVYLIAVTVAGLQQLGAPSWAQYVFNGLALALGVTLSVRLVKAREARAKKAQLRSFEQSAQAAAA